MGHICCTKYGEDGQSALVLDKDKSSNQKKPQRRSKRDIQNFTNGQDENQIGEINLEQKGMSRNHNKNLDREGSNPLPLNPMNTQMNGEEGNYMGSSIDPSEQSVQTFGRSHWSYNSSQKLGKFGQTKSNTQLNTNNCTTAEDSYDQTMENVLHPLPEYRNEITRKMRQRLAGYKDFGISSDKKQLLTQPEFYKEFMVKMKCMKEIQDEGRKKK